MNAMILAAGLGKRMRPLTLTKPKPLLTVAGKPLIQYHVERLAKAGVERIIINHAWLGEQIEAFLGKGERFGVEILYSREVEPLETAGGIRNALDFLQLGNDSTFLLVNGDVFTNYPFARLLGGRDEPCLVLVNNPEHNPGGDFALVGDALVPEGKDCFTFSGISRLPLEMFAALEVDKVMPLAPLLRHAIACGGVKGELYQGYWADIGTPERLAEVNQLVEEQKINGL
ncbi:MAG: mannose-1-phosphate guanylyltransferase [Neptuniibacter caesariensis]|uniref:Mannose-1-phosphate guanylyltransferase n=1 Tax=Neptuniibacter caesariensis TaxID=207954 RepID=A0A2G6JN90_NEPCE|nr:MAG: mannose-1-phosphate guanylyltransferase [Neptuniibacter caesariensis]